MSFFSSLFGGDAKRYAREASAEAKSNLTTGYNTAKDQIGQYLDKSLGELTSGYGTARDQLSTGYGNARNDFNTGVDTAKGTVTDYLGRSTAYLDPWIASGTGNQKILDDYAGVNGTTAQQSMYQSFADQNNPLVAARNAKVAQDAAARANAAGGMYGARALLAATRTGQQMAADDLQRYISNVNASAQRGYGASTQAAGLTQQAGTTLADLENQRGRGLADLSTQLASGQANLYTNEAAAKSGLYSNQGNNLANLSSQYYNALAGNAVNLANAQSQAGLMGAQNAINLGSALLSGFTPGKTGVSAFGNIYNGLQNGFNNLGRTFG